MEEFRKRFPPETISALLKASVPKDDGQKPDPPASGTGSSEKDSKPENDGTLLMDATCCPADVAFPQDFQLLNDARECLEKMVDEFCAENGTKRPHRMKRKCARRDFLNLSKSKKKSAEKIREGIRKQLQYIRRDIRFIVEIIERCCPKVSEKQAEQLNIITTLYEQQLYIKLAAYMSQSIEKTGGSGISA